jgi:hypothetical protein
MKNSFASNTFASDTFASGTWTGLGVAPPVTLPTTIRRVATTEATLGKAARSAETTMARGSGSEDVLRRT